MITQRWSKRNDRLPNPRRSTVLCCCFTVALSSSFLSPSARGQEVKGSGRMFEWDENRQRFATDGTVTITLTIPGLPRRVVGTSSNGVYDVQVPDNRELFLEFARKGGTTNTLRLRPDGRAMTIDLVVPEFKA